MIRLKENILYFVFVFSGLCKPRKVLSASRLRISRLSIGGRKNKKKTVSLPANKINLSLLKLFSQ